MASSLTSRLDGLVLSGTEVRELTGWSDAMVEDYLTILENLILLAEAIETGGQETEDVSNRLISTLLPPRKDVPNTAVATGDFISSGEQKIVCTNTLRATITLNPTPADMELTTVQMAQGTVVVDGNGKTINGENDVIMTQRYTSLDFLYLVEIDAWIIS